MSEQLSSLWLMTNKLAKLLANRLGLLSEVSAENNDKLQVDNVPRVHTATLRSLTPLPALAPALAACGLGWAPLGSAACESGSPHHRQPQRPVAHECRAFVIAAKPWVTCMSVSLCLSSVARSAAGLPGVLPGWRPAE